jgi:hypothetical protein
MTVSLKVNTTNVARRIGILIAFSHRDGINTKAQGRKGRNRLVRSALSSFPLRLCAFALRPLILHGSYGGGGATVLKSSRKPCLQKRTRPHRRR